MIEFSILKSFCLNKDNYLSYNKYLDVNYLKNNYLDLYKIYNVISILYNKYPVEDISKDELLTGYVASYPVLRPQDRKSVEELVGQIFKSKVSEDLLIDYLETHRERAFAGDMAIKALAISEGRGKLDELNALWSQYKARSDAGGVEYVSQDLESLYADVFASGGLSWHLPSLQTSLGPLRKGNFGFVFARPETGKTTFLSHLATHVANKADSESGPILWFNNEQPGAEVQIRLFQSALGITVQDLLKDKAKYTKLYQEVTGGLILVKDDATISSRDIEIVCEKEDPSLIIFDQIDKITGFQDDRYDLELGQRYQWARELAKQHCPVIGVCQSDASGEDVKYLTMQNVANAKTAKQAEADWILGIGCTSKDDFPYYRYLNISKNKLMGDENTIPGERHGKYRVVIEPEIGRYREIE